MCILYNGILSILWGKIVETKLVRMRQKKHKRRQRPRNEDRRGKRKFNAYPAIGIIDISNGNFGTKRSRLENWLAVCVSSLCSTYLSVCACELHVHMWYVQFTIHMCLSLSFGELWTVRRYYISSSIHWCTLIVVNRTKLIHFWCEYIIDDDGGATGLLRVFVCVLYRMCHLYANSLKWNTKRRDKQTHR